MFKKSFALGIILLFILSAMSTLGIGYDKSYIEESNEYNPFGKQHTIKNNRILPFRNNWIKLFPPIEEVDDFGWTVEIDGNYVIVGAPSWWEFDILGSAFIFERELDKWQLQAVLSASEDDEDYSEFGWDVAIDGDYAVVSDDWHNSVYVFRRNGDGWDKQAILSASNETDESLFGCSVSIDGDYIIVGAPYSKGSAYIFKREGDSWYEQDRIVVSLGEEEYWFGYSVAVDGDYAIIGTPSDVNSDSNGSAFIFKRVGDEWYEQAKLSGNGLPYGGDEFGYSVDISGDYAIVGAIWDDHWGAAYVYKRDGEEWERQARLIASNRGRGLFDYEWFGMSVSIDGNYAIVGAPYNDYYRGGSATVFKRVGNSWKEHKKLHNPDGEEEDWFGFGVSISGKHALVGAYNDCNGIGSATIFNISKGKSRIMINLFLEEHPRLFQILRQILDV